MQHYPNVRHPRPLLLSRLPLSNRPVTMFPWVGSAEDSPFHSLEQYLYLNDAISCSTWMDFPGRSQLHCNLVLLGSFFSVHFCLLPWRSFQHLKRYSIEYSITDSLLLSHICSQTSFTALSRGVNSLKETATNTESHETFQSHDETETKYLWV